MTLFKVLALTVVLSWSSSAFAHHPFEAVFDRSRIETITGTVTKVEWQNPHVYTYVDVKDAAGKVDNWKIEMGSPAALSHEGWTRTSLKAGDQVTIQGFGAKSGDMLLNAESFTLANGTSLAAASSLQTKPDAGPIGTSGVQQDRPAGQDTLPATASPLMVYALGGLLSLGVAFGLRRTRQ